VYVFLADEMVGFKIINRQIFCSLMEPMLELPFQVVLPLVKIITFCVFHKFLFKIYVVCMYYCLLDPVLILCNCVLKGVYEALELRDGGSDYLGKGVLKVCADHVLMFSCILAVLAVEIVS